MHIKNCTQENLIAAVKLSRNLTETHEGPTYFTVMLVAYSDLVTAIAELMAGGPSQIKGSNLSKVVFFPDFGIHVCSQ